jgi:benzoyl-CoA reductase/2-hydroxyglutaryl-CoA dehydratase subunit BcrC/BadD/HgdB
MSVGALLGEALTSAAAPGPEALACLGVDVPRELVAAAGLTAWRMPIEGDASPSSLFPGLGARSRSVLARLEAADFAPRGLAVAHDGAEDAQLFAVLRELQRTGRGPAAPFAFIDLLHKAGEPTRVYNLARLGSFKTWLEALTGTPITGDALTAAVKADNAQKRRLAALFAARTDAAPRLSGADALDLIRAVTLVDATSSEALISAIEAGLKSAPALAGKRVLLTGSRHETSAVYRAIEAAGAVIVGEDHAWGDPWVAALLDETLDPLEAISLRSQSPLWPGPVQSSKVRAQALAERARSPGVDVVIHCAIGSDEAAPWDLKATKAALDAQSTPLLAITATDSGLDADTTERLSAFLTTGEVAAPSVKPASARPSAGAAQKPPARPERRSRKSLACTADFGSWQRDWFAGVREQAEHGPIAVVSADAPQEILRALDIPYVVNQWWASIVAAKQKARDYGRRLREGGYPSHIETYSCQGLAAALDKDSDDAPWGGLPTPTILSVVANSDPGAKLYEAWANETGADLFVFERSIDGRIDLPVEWWDDLPERWNETLEPERLDLLEQRIEEQIARLEEITGRTLDRARLVEVMNLVNEQEDYYRRTRNLIARSHPAPVGIVDTMPATMVPQWHRGTVWARDAAKRLFEEVSERVEAGDAACPGEKLRLMWVGRGLWSDTGFYQRWEESHGAVFVWSMYLGLAADGYLRSFEGEHDAVRALAARFVTMGDELRMPTWSGAWHVKEAQLHGCQGAVAIDDADPLVLEALERAGIPVCRVAMNNMGAGTADVDAVITAFIDGLAVETASD